MGPSWILAAIFEAHGVVSEGGSIGVSSHKVFCEAAAQYCSEHCYDEFTRALGSATASSNYANRMRNVLTETLRALDKRFLKDADVLQQDRLASGCAGALLHLDLGPSDRVATAATMGSCAAVIGQRRGGLASATSAPLLLCGGAATTHDALQEFLAWLASEQLAIEALAAKSGARKATSGGSSMRKRNSSKGGALGEGAAAASSGTQHSRGGLSAPRPQQEPRYSQDPTAAHAIGFGCAKGMGWVVDGDIPGAAMLSPRRKPRLGMTVQTASHFLGPGDECVVLLSGGAAATITPADVALLMHRMGPLSAIPYETKAPPLPLEDARGSLVQLDSLGTAGPRPAPPHLPAAVNASVPATPRGDAGTMTRAVKRLPIPPFNAARLLVQHATAVAATQAGRQPPKGAGSGASLPPATGALALTLDWPTSTGGDTVAAAASGASVPAIRAAAAAAARDRRRGVYLWQLLRMYYKVPYKRKVATITRWHDLFDQLVAKACREARSKEVTAWKRLGAVLQVSNAGNVKSVTPQPSARQPSAGYPHQSPNSARYTSPGPAPHSARYRSPRSSAAAAPGAGSGGTGLSAAAAVALVTGGSRQPSPRTTPTSARYRSPRRSPGRAGATTTAGQYGSPAPPAASSSVRNRSPVTPSMRQGGPMSPTGGHDGEGLRGRPPSARKMASGAHSARELQAGGSLRHMTPRSAATAAAAGAASDAAAAPPPLTRPSPLIDMAPAAAAVGRDASATGTPIKCSDGSGGSGSAAQRVAILRADPQGGRAAQAVPSTPRVSLISNLDVSQLAATAPPPVVPPLATALAAALALVGSGADGNPTPRLQGAAARSNIPTLQLLPGASGAQVPHHSTPRLSAPGGPAATPPPQRANNTCGGAINTTPTATFTATAADPAGPLTSARSGCSRLPRPMSQTLLSGATTPLPSSRGPSPIRAAFQAYQQTSDGGSGSDGATTTSTLASAAGQAANFRAPPLDTACLPAGAAGQPPVAAYGMPSSGGAVPAAAEAALGQGGPLRKTANRSAGGRIGSAAGAVAAPTGTSCGGGDLDLLSPDANQLAAWAMEAVAIIASPRTKECDDKAAAAAAATPGSGAVEKQRQPLSQRQGQGQELGRAGAKVATGIAAAAAAAGSSERPLSARPAAGSRIPLSPRDDNGPSQQTTPRSLMGGKSSMALGSGALDRSTGGSTGDLTPRSLRTASMRARR